MMMALDKFEGGVTIGGRKINNLRFADDIDLIARSLEELNELTERLDKMAAKFGMEISAEKSKIMTTPNNGNNVNTTVKIGNNVLDQVKEFKYLGAHITEDGTSTREVKTRIAIATQQLSKMKKIWCSRSISMKVKINLLKAIVVATALYGCDTWTLTENLENRLEAFEMRCFRRLLRIPYTAHRTNASVRQEIERIIGKYEPLLEIVRRRKLQWFGHVTRHPGTLSHTILQGSIEGKRPRGHPKTKWTDNIKKWTGKTIIQCHRIADDREEWKKTVQTAKAPLRPHMAMGQ